MDQREAFKDTLALAIEMGMPEVSPLGDSLGLAHMRAMDKRIDEGNFSESKLGRWLGWAQAALVAANVGVGLEDVKLINLYRSDDEAEWKPDPRTLRWAADRISRTEPTYGNASEFVNPYIPGAAKDLRDYADNA